MLTKAELAAQIRARLEGRQSEAQLAEWAFDRFYAVELGSETIDPAHADQIATVLDDLMFATDDSSFALDDASLRTILSSLEEQ